MDQSQLDNLSIFQGWLNTLGTDVLLLAELLEQRTLEREAELHALGSLNYLLRLVDLAPAGLEDLVYLDAASVMRLAFSNAGALNTPETAVPERLLNWVAESGELKRLVGADLMDVEQVHTLLSECEAKGQSAGQIIDDDAERSAHIEHLRRWAKNYRAPQLPAEARQFIKMQAYLVKKLQARPTAAAEFDAPS